MKWNFNVESLKKLISVCFISAYKRHGLGTRALVQFFCTFVRPMTDCARRVFHDSLPAYLSNELLGSTKRESLVESGLIKLSDRRQELVDKLFKEVENKENKLHCILPALNNCRSNLRNTRKFRPVFKTNRFHRSLLPSLPSRLKLCFYSFTVFDCFSLYYYIFIF